MLQIKYDKQNNSLTVSEDGRPVAGIVGAMSNHAFNQIITTQIYHLKKQSKTLQEWLYNEKNINAENWSDRKRLLNNISMKIEQLKDRINPKSKHYGIADFSMPSKNIRTNC